MYHRYRALGFCLLGLVVFVSPVRAQSAATPATADPPAIRRWLDVQSLIAAMRYRFTENSAGRETVSDVQWQTQFRGRLLFDKGGKYHIGSFVTTGSSFRSGWNYTGAGLNEENHPLKVRQLWFGAAPTKTFEFQAGGLAVNRGELSDLIASDNDSFIVATRVTGRPAKGWLTQLSATVGHFDSSAEPDLFKQLDDADDINYGQALVGFRFGPRVSASIDYTYEDGRDVLREGVTVRLPSSVAVVTSLRAETYQRVDPDSSAGFNLSADLRVRKLTGTVGVVSTDRGFGPFNGDRYELGSRYYYVLNYPVTPEFALQLFHTRAFNIDFPITIKQRFDFVLTCNPTAFLKRHRVF